MGVLLAPMLMLLLGDERKNEYLYWSLTDQTVLVLVAERAWEKLDLTGLDLDCAS